MKFVFEKAYETRRPIHIGEAFLALVSGSCVICLTVKVAIGVTDRQTDRRIAALRASFVIKRRTSHPTLIYQRRPKRRTAELRAESVVVLISWTVTRLCRPSGRGRLVVEST